MKDHELRNMLITIVVALAGIWLVLQTVDEPFQITTAECPFQQVEKEVVQIKEGWKCEPLYNQKEYDSDLLQPSGLWGSKAFDCWKLIMPIEEFCDKYPCSTNNGKPPHPTN